MEEKTRVLKMAYITTAALGAVLAFVLLLMFLASPRIQAAPLRRYRASTGDDPEINHITMTADFSYYDPTSGDGIDKTVYFNNAAPGAITMTFDISGTPTLTLTTGAAFYEPERTYTSAITRAAFAVTYSVATTHATHPRIIYTASNTNGVQAAVAITYVQDITAPTVSIITPSAGHCCVTSTQVVITGTTRDNEDGSGVQHVQVTTAAAWITADGAASWTYIWTLPITDHVVYTLTARAYDRTANVGVSPDVTVTVDTVAPVATAPTPDRSPWVTSAISYTWPDSNDNAGLAGYQVNITNTEGYNGLFSTVNPVLTFTQAFTEGAGYYARVRAIDNNGNAGDWSDPSTVVTPDLTVPIVMTPSIDMPQGSKEYLYAIGTTLYYTNQVDDPPNFYIEGYSLDDLSGVDRVTFSPAFGESPVEVTSGFWPWRPVWPGYGIDPDTEAVGVITATVYDKAGNTKIQTYTYALDGAPPASTAWSPDYATGSPIAITWAATDTQSGVYSATLWYKKETTGVWTSSLATGISGAFAFNPLSGDGTYYFQTVAADNVANVEAGPAGDGDDFTVYDTIPPTHVTITAPRHIFLTQFFVSWSAQDATSGVATYTVEYSGTAYTAWQEWLTGVISTEAEFHAPATETDYVFHVTAYDWAGNNDWKETTTRVGIFYIYMPLVMRSYPPLWQQASGTDEIGFYDVAVCPLDPLLQYAGTKSNGLYYSKDGGNTWRHWALDGRATPVVVNPTNCNEAFVAVWGSGVYRVTGQNQATPINQGLEELYLYGLAITPDGQTLYAGSASHGVFRTSIIADVNWIALNNSIPPDDLRIRSLYIINDVLYAGSRQCTYYHSKNGGDSWSKATILGGGQAGKCEDAQVWTIAQVDGVLYAGLGLDKGLYRRSTGGIWTRVSDVPAVNIFRFGLLFHQSQLYVSAYGHGVYTCGADGRCQPFWNGGLSTSDVRGLAITEINASPRLLAGSDDGIWWVPLIP